MGSIVVKMQYVGPTGYYWITGKKYRFTIDNEKDIIFPCYIQSPKNRKTGQQSRINYQTEESFEKDWRLL